MARSVVSILDSLVALKDADRTLDVFNKSDLAYWYKLFHIFSQGINQLEGVMDGVKPLLQKPDLQYWVTKIREFQFGDTLKFSLEKGYYYDNIDSSKQIVKYVSIEEDTNILTLKIKVAKGGNIITKLTTAEKDALLVYAKNIKILGTKVEVYSNDPDELEIEIANVNIIGQETEDEATLKMHKELDNYLRELSFTGVLEVSDLWAIFNRLDFIDDTFYIRSIKGKKAGDPAFNNIVHSYTSDAGYMRCVYDKDSALDNQFNVSFV